MNLVIFKGCLALLVIYSHVALYADTPTENMFANFGGYAAVNIFFFISAYFLTLKYSSKCVVDKEVISRLKRLIPAGMMASLLIGLWLLATSDISLPDLVGITIKNGLYGFGIEYDYPCAFSCEQGGEKLNSSLWSMPFELYFTLALIPFVYFGLRQPHALNFLLGLFIAIVALTVCINVVGVTEETVFLKASRVLFWFCFGVVVAAVSSWDKPVHSTLVGGVLVSLLVGSFFVEVMPLCLFTFVVAFFNPETIKKCQRFMTRNRPRLDPTYGAYLIGFPVQQILFWQFGIADIVTLFSLTSIVAISYGLFSNYYLESST